MPTEEELDRVVNMPNRIRVEAETLTGVFIVVYVIITANGTAFLVAIGFTVFVHLLFEWSFHTSEKQLNKMKEERLKKQKQKLEDK